MGLDVNAIRQKLKDLQNTNNKRQNLWKPEPGEQIIRIVPYQHDRSNPFLELYFHYEVAKKNYLSPISFGEADPIAEFAEKLKNNGSKEDWTLGRKIEPKMRVYVPIIVRGKEQEGVKFWGFGKRVYEELLKLIADPDYGDITDPQNGRDIVVEFTQAESGGYPKTSIRVKPNVTPVTTDKDVLVKIAKEQQEITEIFKVPTYDELKEVLEKWLNPDESDEEDSSEEAGSTNTNTAVATGVTATKNVDDAFDELFND